MDEDDEEQEEEDEDRHRGVPSRELPDLLAAASLLEQRDQRKAAEGNQGRTGVLRNG